MTPTKAPQHSPREYRYRYSCITEPDCALKPDLVRRLTVRVRPRSAVIMPADMAFLTLLHNRQYSFRYGCCVSDSGYLRIVAKRGAHAHYAATDERFQEEYVSLPQ